MSVTKMEAFALGDLFCIVYYPFSNVINNFLFISGIRSSFMFPLIFPQQKAKTQTQSSAIR